MSFPRIETAEETSRKVKEIYDSPILEIPPPQNARYPAILHVAAVYLDPSDGKYKVIKVDNKNAPRSDHDSFALNLARARVDAIITSGQVVRLEKGLTHALQGPAPQGLQNYRSTTLDKPETPYSLILTRKVPDLEAEIFTSKATRPIIYTSTDSYNLLQGNKALKDLGILVCDGGSSPEIEGALEYLKILGVASISMEAGPSVANPLYKNGLVSELMLSVYRGDIQKEVIGDEFISKEEIEKDFDMLHKFETDEWSFFRYVSK
ncbi:MAG: dihydrofolate reductase family protein [Nanoarchaeota archaeon]|nr:dihydrofolate reductase family protein [Nanoarchaeota archaeon]